jgi:hypothetical protein
MRLAIIASAPDTPAYNCHGDIELAFAHLCLSDAKYAAYFREAARSGREVILDNGVMELPDSAAAQALVEVCWQVRPALVTPPEILGDGPSTLELTREFVSRGSCLPPETGFLGVAHGRDFQEWMASFRALADMREIGRIGIPYDIQFEVPGTRVQEDASVWESMLKNRLRVVELLDQAGLNRKPVHLLGCVDAIELRAQSRFAWIVSNDSSTVWVTTQQGLEYDPSRGIDCAKKKIDMASRMPPGRMDLFRRNLAVVRGFISGGAGAGH